MTAYEKITLAIFLALFIFAGFKMYKAHQNKGSGPDLTPGTPTDPQRPRTRK